MTLAGSDVTFSSGTGGSLLGAGPVQATLLEDEGLADRFRGIDWSFSSSLPDRVSDIHPYPAKFIREIPAHALALVDGPGDVVDPFCGSGTTLVESARAGRHAIGIDLNPIATLVSRAKLSGWAASDAEKWQTHRAMLIDAIRRGDVDEAKRARVVIPRLDHWFTSEAQLALAGATAYLRTLAPTDPWHDRVAAAISAIVVRVSRQESDTRYAAIDKATDVSSIAEMAGRSLDKIVRAASSLASEIGPVSVEVLTGDAATLVGALQPDTAAAAIFSPPYPNAYEYWLYHKYRMYWLGYDPVDVRANEIGARPFYSGSGRLTEDDFARQMQDVLDGLFSVIRSEGICLVVVGDSIIRGRLVDNGAVVSSVAQGSGFEPVASAQRTIRRTRRSFNLAVARASHEHVLLFRKP